MLSILFVTYDRGEITPEVLRHNLMNMTSGEDVELLICDQGSTDQGTLQLFNKIRLHEIGQAMLPEFIHANVVRTHFRANKRNEGVGRSLNQLFLESKGDVIMTMGNDIKMPQDWDKEMLGYVRGVVNSGIVGMDWGHSGTPEVTTSRDGINAKWLDSKLDKVFGPMMIRREVIDRIGFFHEDFHPYGFEDSDLNNRINIAGYRSLYVPTMKCEHVGHDVGSGTAYRKMKDDSMAANQNRLGDRMNNYSKNGIIEPLPPKREALT